MLAVSRRHSLSRRLAAKGSDGGEIRGGDEMRESDGGELCEGGVGSDGRRRTLSRGPAARGSGESDDGVPIRQNSDGGESVEMRALAEIHRDIKESIVALSVELKMSFESLRHDFGYMQVKNPASIYDQPGLIDDSIACTKAEQVAATELFSCKNSLPVFLSEGSLHHGVVAGNSLKAPATSPTLEFSAVIDAEDLPSETPQARTSICEHRVSALPARWPACLTARQAVQESLAMSHHTSSRMVVRSATERSRADNSPRKKRSLWQRGVMNPNSLLKTCFEACGIAILLYDLTATPYMLAWEMDATKSPVSTFGLTVAIYWTVDMGLNFNTGFYDHGELKLDRIAISYNYLKTWFLLDFVIIVCDWLSIVFNDLAVAVTAAKLLRIARFISLWDNFNDRILSENTRLVLRIVSIVIAIFFFNHFMCCSWYALGRLAPSDTGAHWLEVFLTVGTEDRPYVDLSPSYQYFTVLHWYLSQMTVGNEMIYCYSTAERIFNIVGTMIGLFINCSLVSSLSTIMLELHMEKTDQKSKLRTLTQFLRENHVEPQVAVLVQKQVRDRLIERYSLTDAEVPALAVISSQLRSQLRLEIYSPHIMRHPLFRLWSSVDDNALQSLCYQAIHFKFLRPQDELFVAGMMAENAYLFGGGTLNYVQEPESSPVERKTSINVSHGSWLSEVALWVEDWTHVGSAEAVDQCKVIVVHQSGVSQALPRYGVVQLLTQEYALAFHRRLMAAMPPHGAWPSDLGVQLTDYSDLVTLMTSDAQIAIGMNAVDQMQQRMWGKGKATEGLENLREEILKGKSVVIMNESGEPERLASVLALRIELSDDLILVQIGKWDTVQVKSTCQLPGGKLDGGEMLEDALGRLMGTKLKPLVGLVEIMEMERQVTWKESKEYGIRTKYLRTVCFANLKATLRAPICRAKRRSQMSSSSHSPKVYSNGSKNVDVVDLFGKEIFCFKVDDQGKWDLYSWLSPAQLDHLSSGAGESILLAWLRAVDFDALMRDCDAASQENGSDVGLRDRADSVDSAVTDLTDSCVETHPIPYATNQPNSR